MTNVLSDLNFSLGARATGLPRASANGHALTYEAYTFATLPTLGTDDFAIAFCSDYPGIGRTEVTWTGSYWRPLGLVGSTPPPRSGADIMGSVNSSSPATQALVANTIRAFPFNLEHRVTLDRVSAAVTASVAASNFIVGLYYDTGTGLPGSLIAGSVSPSWSGAAVTAFNQLLTSFTVFPGRIWCVVAANAALTLRSIPAGGLANWIGINSTLAANSQFTGWTNNRTYDGTLPANFPLAGITALASTSAPLVAYRVA